MLKRLSWLSLVALCGCSSLMNHHFSDSLVPETRNEAVAGLTSPVKVSRSKLGIPLIEAANQEDMAFSLGYVAAEDRLGQMIGARLMAQGRLAEASGAGLLDIDIYMRSLDLEGIGQLLYQSASENTRRLLNRYADGVNAYMRTHPLPPDLRLAGISANPWQAKDSMSLFALLNLGLAFNAHEELAYLKIAQAVGPEKAAWLTPIYPDEPLPFDEASKLKDVPLNGPAVDLGALSQIQNKLASLNLRPFAASNNWIVHKSRTAGGASILANDTHLPLVMPSFWHYVHAKAPGFDAAGVAMAGIPGIVAGTNGKLAWGMTMVMADNQDTYLEKLRWTNNTLEYLSPTGWKTASARQVVFEIKGSEARTVTLYSTAHGPLINLALQSSKYPLLTPTAQQSPYGIALNWAMHEPDQSADAFMQLNKAQSVSDAAPIIRGIRAIPLNFVYADKDNIAWQVTGRYPLRKEGRGLLPSPGWSDRYDWQGYLDPDKHPHQTNPVEGFIGTANDRTVPANHPDILTSSWFYPERGERIHTLLSQNNKQTLASTKQMQYDEHDSFIEKIKPILSQESVNQAISVLPVSNQAKAKEALSILQNFDGNMHADSTEATIVGAFYHVFAVSVFGDELGAPNSPEWDAFVSLGDGSYSAIPDHLLQREDSPFWDDIRTPSKENKSTMLARSLASTIEFIESKLGKNRANWTWGKLHTYHFETDGSRLASAIGGVEKWGFGLVGDYFNRGPYPAGGDHTTLNVSAFQIGKDFNTWLVPAMRLIVDFSLEEPMLALNSTGQSGNPASPHYEDGIHAWLQGDYMAFPFKAENQAKVYIQTRNLIPSVQ